MTHDETFIDLLKLTVLTLFVIAIFGLLRMIFGTNLPISYEHAFPLALGVYAILSENIILSLLLLIVHIVLEGCFLGFSEFEIIDNLLMYFLGLIGIASATSAGD